MTRAKKAGGSPTDPAVAAETAKLAHTLGTDAARLAMLAKIPAADLRILRQQIGEALFQADKAAFVRVAALSKAIPGAVAAKLTQATLPPLLAARTAELLEPARAVDLVGRISESYLADVSAAMDASRAREVVSAIPPARVASVGAELARRGEWVVMGGFVSVGSEPALRAAVGVLDGEQLLRTGFVVDDLTRLDRIGAMLTDVQVDELLAAAVTEQLWSELTHLLDHLSEPRFARTSERFAAAPDEVRDGFGAAAGDGRLRPEHLARLQGS